MEIYPKSLLQLSTLYCAPKPYSCLFNAPIAAGGSRVANEAFVAIGGTLAVANSRSQAGRTATRWVSLLAQFFRVWGLGFRQSLDNM